MYVAFTSYSTLVEIIIKAHMSVNVKNDFITNEWEICEQVNKT